MDKKEYIKEFVNKFIALDYEGIYRYFTKETIVYLIDEDKIINVPEFLETQKNFLEGKKVLVKRVFSSAVCEKYELQVDEKIVSYFFEVINRRIGRVEVSAKV